MIESQIDAGGPLQPKTFPISDGKVYEYWKAKIEEVKERETLLGRIKKEKPSTI